MRCKNVQLGFRASASGHFLNGHVQVCLTGVQRTTPKLYLLYSRIAVGLEAH